MTDKDRNRIVRKQIRRSEMTIEEKRKRRRFLRKRMGKHNFAPAQGGI